jgi:ornithine carbamoyltransferase
MKHFLSLQEWPRQALLNLLEEASGLKRGYGRDVSQSLSGKMLALIFERPSLRTRISFEVAMQQLGGSALYLTASEIGLGKRESLADLVRALGQYVHGIVARVFDHHRLLEIARYAPVPVINGLTRYCHPCQAVADVLTLHEEFGSVRGLKLAYLGHSNQDVARSLAFAAAQFGFQLILASPPAYRLDGKSIEAARALGSEDTITVLRDSLAAVAQADALYTDVWINDGTDPLEAEKRLQIFRPFQLNEQLLSQAQAHAVVMHCMPVHRGREMTDGVADGSRSRLLEQAANRLHAQKAILLRLLG